MTALDFLLRRQPWLIAPEAFRAMATKAFGFFDNQIKLPESAGSPLLSVEDGVGIISLHGPMMRNPDIISRPVTVRVSVNGQHTVDRTLTTHDPSTLSLEMPDGARWALVELDVSHEWQRDKAVQIATVWRREPTP